MHVYMYTCTCILLCTCMSVCFRSRHWAMDPTEEPIQSTVEPPNKDTWGPEQVSLFRGVLYSEVRNVLAL